jgi:sulfite reductase alpha subunit-like flavoprotein
LHVAFSRETEQKVYVQDKIWEQRLEVWKLLKDPKAMIFICGDARSMAPDVKRAFQKVAEECGGKSVAGAQNMISAMVETDRYLEDVWAA